jgi:hypothetical protein
MVQPLRKHDKDGKPYQRRPAVEKELQNLETLALTEIVTCARAGEQKGKPSVSSEALVHILRREVRVVTTRSPMLGKIEALLQVLTQRAEATVRHQLWGFKAEIDREEICKEVTDRIVDGISADSDRMDYAEVNFNDWLKHSRLDACRKQKRTIETFGRHGDAVNDLAKPEEQIVSKGIEGMASTEPGPEAAYELSESREKASLPPEIERGRFSARDRYRIEAMVKRANLRPEVLKAFLMHVYLEMHIDSQDPRQHTLVKHFGKSDKTIRLWIEEAQRAFAKLIEMKDENEPYEARKPGIGTT